jgi:hypothetical protein
MAFLRGQNPFISDRLEWGNPTLGSLGLSKNTRDFGLPVPRCLAITNSAGALILAVSDGSLNHRSSSIGLPRPTTARIIPPRRLWIGPHPTEAPRNHCPSGAELKFRNHSPPPASPSQRGPADAVSQSRGSGAGLGPVRDVRMRRAGYDQTLFDPVSLTGIDAVPLRESSNRSQRGAGRGGPAVPAAYLPVVRLNLRAVCAARSSPTADRVWSDASR